MKKYKILINVLLVCICVFAIISCGLMIKLCNNCYSNYISLVEVSTRFPDAVNLTESLSLFLQTLFAVLFSGLSAIASGFLLIILNFTDAKNALFKHSQLTKERKNAKAQAKAERAEEAKQAKIQALEDELNQLKNN